MHPDTRVLLLCLSLCYCSGLLGSEISDFGLSKDCCTQTGWRLTFEVLQGWWQRVKKFTFYDFTSLALSSGRNIGKHTEFLLTMGICREREMSEWGGVFPLNHYHC